MTNKIQIPSTIAELKPRLVGLTAIVGTSQWSIAAMVYAFTTEDDRGGPRPRNRGEITAVSCREFARLGIHGLRSDQTVRRYRQAWADAIADGRAKEARPGRAVALPDGDFPRDDRPGAGVEDRRPLDRVRSDMRKLTPQQKAEVVRETAMQPEVIAAETERRKRRFAEVNPDALTSEADIKASRAATREAFQPMRDSLANLQVVGAIEAAAAALRAARPDEELMAQIDEALADLQLARHELDFRGVSS